MSFFRLNPMSHNTCPVPTYPPFDGGLPQSPVGTVCFRCLVILSMFNVVSLQKSRWVDPLNFSDSTVLCWSAIFDEKAIGLNFGEPFKTN